MPHLSSKFGRWAATGAMVALAAGCGPQGGRTRVAAGPAAPRTPAAAKAALQANAQRPFVPATIEPMQPFVLKASAADRQRAVQCLAQAVYYEAAREPLKGQQAVAQVVLNRVRHPAYPKSVCAVVYQGAQNPTGCQFTFTCDGSLRWKPEPAYWDRAEAVARRALAGYVDPDVGSATHYHAVYVDPYWAPTLTEMTQVGQHIFYRWNGGWGEPRAFTGRYAGHEAVLTPAVLKSGDVKPPEGAPPAAPVREVTLTVGGGVRAYKVAAGEPGEPQPRAPGMLTPTRRRPTPEEVRRINDAIGAIETQMDAKAATATAQAAAGGGGAG